MSLTSYAALWLLPGATLISIWVAWSDLKFMRIPNKAVGALTLVFLIFGLIALPFDEYLWRWTHLIAVLIVGFLVASAGLVGAGDAKFAAAMAPFVALGDVRFLVVIFTAALLGAFTTHRLMRAIPAMRRATPDWESWTNSDFPMGLALGGTLIFYLGLAAFLGG